ncbi:MAG: LacI family DNA-binding transcriptional regulator [Reichenbachiella sp.]|uniref:LacI family DNA-binding transcriptional regulator n=1 Tax=Reichenbachiella sp. TaxID=2184521 RepID=UPI0032971506
MINKITIHDIARKLNIDSSTVSRALANSDRVKLKTRELVKKTADELGYRRNHLASNLRKQRSYTIGVIVPYINRHFFSTVISGIEESASKQGYKLIICQSGDQEQKDAELMEMLINNQVDAIFISMAMTTTNTEHFKLAQKIDIPIILFDRIRDDLPFPSVVIDDYQAALETCELLAKKGYQSIAHIGGRQNVSIYKNRYLGYLDAIEKFNLNFCDDWHMECNMESKDGVEFANKIMHMKKRPDAILCANDIVAISAMRTLQAHSIEVPKDIALIGFSNEPLSAYTSPPLTTVDQKALEIGQLAFNLFQKHQDKVGQVERMKVKSSIIQRSSC